MTVALFRPMRPLPVHHVSPRLGPKLLDTMPAAEMIGSAVMVDGTGGPCRDDVHAADRVFDRPAAMIVALLVQNRQTVVARVHER